MPVSVSSVILSILDNHQSYTLTHAHAGLLSPAIHSPISRVGHCCLRVRLYMCTHAQTVFTLSIVINRTENALATKIIKHKHMLMYGIIIRST